MPVFDSIAERFDRWFDEDGREIFLEEVRCLNSIFPEFTKGIEIGIGSGRFSVEIGIPIGIDPSMELLKMAKNRGIVSICGKGEQLPFKPNSFDLVLLNTTLCFVSNPEKVLNEAKMVLVPDGHIVLGIINRESKVGREYQKKGETGHSVYSHARLFSEEEAVELLKKTGFTLMDVCRAIKADNSYAFIAMVFRKYEKLTNRRGCLSLSKMRRWDEED